MEQLTLQEESVMQVFWKIKQGYIKDILQELPTNMPYTTLASIVKNLEKKKYVKGTKKANAYLYKTKIDAATYQQNVMENMVDHYFDNSYKNLVSFFVSNEKLHANELEELLKMIKNKKS